MLIDDFQLPHGYWEAKDIHDDLPAEVLSKFEKGYPRDNILFQTPQRAILWQNDQETLDADLNDPIQLIEALETFFSHRPQEYTEWEDAVAQFKGVVPALGDSLAALIQKERDTNPHFTTAFKDFYEKCRQSINPNLSEAAVEEMLIQHLLTERIFRTVFSNPDFTDRNVIAREIEIVIKALTEQAFSRDDFSVASIVSTERLNGQPRPSTTSPKNRVSSTRFTSSFFRDFRWRSPIHTGWSTRRNRLSISW